jgi:hypothetical protein
MYVCMYVCMYVYNNFKFTKQVSNGLIPHVKSYTVGLNRISKNVQ